METNSDPPSVTISQCVTLKLNDKNFLMWKLQFEQFLSSQTLLGYVTGDTPRPAPTITAQEGNQVVEVANPEYTKWIRSDQLVMAWLFGSLTENALRAVYGLKTSQEVWFALAKKYNRVSTTRRLDLQRRLQTTAKGNKNMSDYLSEMKSICDQLDSIGSPITEQEKIYGVLNGLGKEYESICTVIENTMDTIPGPNLEDAIFKLTGFEEKLQAYEDIAQVTPHQAFYTTREGNNYRDNNRGRGQNRGGYRGRSNYSTQGRGFTQQFNNNEGQGSGRGSHGNYGSKPTCQICGKYGHAAYKCFKRFDHSYQIEDQAEALAVMRVPEHDTHTGNEWFPDTGATHHVTNSPQNLQTAHPYEGNDSVMVGNGDFLPITHIGSIALPSTSGQANKSASQSGKQD